ncbi:hypothetical protein AALO_G00080500 [Alosa alosa]|uniref:Myb/SANT-like DNA-binding domain-containing protein n=1 Tax=Alosa alosa TaxID=278164 RepID=A0AAV6H143_9TELE|nr:uncharacterized protein si:dkey-66i24.7 [Alosa alosa]KAG5279687.1 hypothetical protein AALO_G00080500 [Alosa alosa]
MEEVIETIVTESIEVEESTTTLPTLEPERAKGEFVWTLQATWQLVNTRLEMDQEFDQPVCKKKKLWETVAERVTSKLQAAGNLDVAVKAYECDLKWRNMLATYRKNTERAKRLGAQSVHWEFFKAMHNVLGKSREEIEAQRKAKLNGTKLGKAIASKRFTPILPIPSITAAPTITAATSITATPMPRSPLSKLRMCCISTWSYRRGR